MHARQGRRYELTGSKGSEGSLKEAVKQEGRQ